MARQSVLRGDCAGGVDWVTRERCESGRIGLTANELTGETWPEGSNPSLSALVASTAVTGSGLSS